MGFEWLRWDMGGVSWMIQMLHPNIHPDTSVALLSPLIPDFPHPGSVWDEDGEEK